MTKRRPTMTASASKQWNTHTVATVFYPVIYTKYEHGACKREQIASDPLSDEETATKYAQIEIDRRNSL